jgi:hypothetical protein
VDGLRHSDGFGLQMLLQLRIPIGTSVLCNHLSSIATSLENQPYLTQRQVDASVPDLAWQIESLAPDVLSS